MSEKRSRRHVEMTRTDEVPADAAVRHFDELGERTQRVLFDVAHRDAEGGRVCCLDDGDVVVFTDYFRVSAT